MLYATDEIHTDDDFNKAMVGVASIWCVLPFLLLSIPDKIIRYEGNP